MDDAGKHAAMAGMAGTYLAYCDCVRKGSGEKLSIVAAFTGGDSDNLIVGRNGIFYDRAGPRLGRHHHQNRGQPDQHPAGVLVAV